MFLVLQQHDMLNLNAIMVLASLLKGEMDGRLSGVGVRTIGRREGKLQDISN